MLAHVGDDGALIGWITPQHLGAAGLTEEQAAGHAWSNLDTALRQAQVTTGDVDGVALGMLATSFPSKASLGCLSPSWCHRAGVALRRAARTPGGMQSSACGSRLEDGPVRLRATGA